MRTEQKSRKSPAGAFAPAGLVMLPGKCWFRILLHEGVGLHLLDVAEVLFLHVGRDQIAQRARGQRAVLQCAVERLAAEGTGFHSLHGGDDHGRVVGHLRADDALVLAEDVCRLADVVDLDLACSGVGGIDGLARAGVNGGSVAEEDVSALGDQLGGKFLALRGVGEGVGVRHVEQLDGPCLPARRRTSRLLQSPRSCPWWCRAPCRR